MRGRPEGFSYDFSEAELPPELLAELQRLQQGGDVANWRKQGSNDWEQELWNDGSHAQSQVLEHFRKLASGAYGTERGGDNDREVAEQRLREQGFGNLLDSYDEHQTALATPQLQYLDFKDYALEPLESFQNDELLLGPSEVAQASADPRSLQAQNQALQQLSQWGKGEATDADRAMYEASDMQNRLQADQQARAQRDALMQQFSSRGLGGSTADLAAQMSANQAQTQRYALADAQNRANMLGNIQNRALQSIAQQGSLGSQMRGQSFGEAVQRGSAADDFNRNNMDFRRGTYAADVTAENNRRISNNQRRYDNDRNNTNVYNTGLQQQFNNQNSIATGRANQHNNQAGYNESRRREQQQIDANRTAGLGRATSSYGRRF